MTQQQINFRITGFGEFAGVKNNPTEYMMGNIRSYLEGAPLESGINLVDATVLETSGAGSLERLTELRSVSHEPCVWVHFGVGVVGPYKLEEYGHNEANFRNPDQRGWQPLNKHIDEKKSIGHKRQTSLPVSELCTQLSGQGFEVAVSDDPGRFVCNWTYYHSLRMAEGTSDRVLFVHVPPFEAKPVEEQLSFMRAVINTVGKHVLTQLSASPSS